MSDLPGEPMVVTQDDLDGLNRRAALHTIDLARRASWVLLGVAAVLFLAWLWTALRTQGVISNEEDETFTPVFSGEDLSIRERVDFLAVTIDSLGTAFLLAGIGVAIRLYCDVATLRVGGSLTGWEVGDSVEPELVELDET